MTIQARRVSRAVPKDTIELLPAQGVLVEGTLDYLDDGATPAPADALYVAHLEGGKVTKVKDTLPPGKPGKPKHPHTFAGWPMPGEEPVEVPPKP